MKDSNHQGRNPPQHLHRVVTLTSTHAAKLLFKTVPEPVEGLIFDF
jgi:hypothetical protein